VTAPNTRSACSPLESSPKKRARPALGPLHNDRDHSKKAVIIIGLFSLEVLIKEEGSANFGSPAHWPRSFQEGSHLIWSDPLNTYRKGKYSSITWRLMRVQPLGYAISRAGQNHIYTLRRRYFWQDNHQMYGHIRCVQTVLANPSGQLITQGLEGSPGSTLVLGSVCSVVLYRCCFLFVLHTKWVELARTVCARRIWPYIWWLPCQKYRMYTVQIWFWPTL